MSLASFLNLNGLVESPTVSKSTMGGVTKEYSTLIVALPCTLARKNLKEFDKNGKLTVRNILRLYCEAGATALTITEDDRITINSQIYLIETIHNPAALNRHLEMDVVLIK